MMYKIIYFWTFVFSAKNMKLCMAFDDDDVLHSMNYVYVSDMNMNEKN